MSASAAVIDFILNNQRVLLQTDFMKEIWMIPDRLTGTPNFNDPSKFTIQTEAPLYINKLFVHGDHFYTIKEFSRDFDNQSEIPIYKVIADSTQIPYDALATVPLCTPQDKFVLKAGQIENYPEGPDLNTNLGRFIANYLFLVYPFDKRIPYLNETLNYPKLEKIIASALFTGLVTTREAKDKYGNAISLFGQANEVICPGISEKTISVPEHITLLRRKLVEENREALEAGDASVMSDIEQALIKEYRKHLEGDSSLHFLLKPKYFNVSLKKLLLTQGMTEVFGSPGKFTYVEQPMGSGWKVEDLPTIFNEVRSGSYARAVETADGGVIAKLTLRVLQDTQIAIPDCGTKRGELVNSDIKSLKDFEWNYVIEPDGTNTLLSDQNLDQYTNRDIVVRTPGYCESKLGFCAKCFGKVFETIGQKAFAPLANDFAKTQTTNSLKKMHGSDHAVVDVSDLNKYILEGR